MAAPPKSVHPRRRSAPPATAGFATSSARGRRRRQAQVPLAENGGLPHGVVEAGDQQADDRRVRRRKVACVARLCRKSSQNGRTPITSRNDGRNRTTRHSAATCEPPIGRRDTPRRSRTWHRLRCAITRQKRIIADPARRDDFRLQQRQNDVTAAEHQRTEIRDRTYRTTKFHGLPLCSPSATAAARAAAQKLSKAIMPAVRLTGTLQRHMIGWRFGSQQHRAHKAIAPSHRLAICPHAEGSEKVINAAATATVARDRSGARLRAMPRMASATTATAGPPVRATSRRRSPRAKATQRPPGARSPSAEVLPAVLRPAHPDIRRATSRWRYPPGSRPAPAGTGRAPPSTAVPFVEPFAAFDEFLTEISEVSDRTAERCQAESGRPRNLADRCQAGPTHQDHIHGFSPRLPLGRVPRMQMQRWACIIPNVRGLLHRECKWAGKEKESDADKRWPPQE